MVKGVATSMPAIGLSAAGDRRGVVLRRAREARAVVVPSAVEAAARRVDVRRVPLERRDVDRRGVAADVAEDAVPARRREVEAALRRVLEPAARRVLEPAARRVELAARRVDDAARRVDVAARLVDEEARLPVLLAAWRACLVRLSMRFNTLFTSARVLAFLTCDDSSLIAARAVLSASFSLRSTWRRTLAGTRFSASRSARCPALIARPTSPELRVERRDVRFLFPMDDPPINKPADALTQPA